MSNVSKPTLIPGGCGFVGRHLTLHYLSMGKEVWVIDDLSSGKHPDEWVPSGFQQISKFALPWIVYEGPIRLVVLIDDCRAFFAGRVQSNGPALPEFGDTMHCAAVVGGREMISNQPLSVAINLAIDASFFNWAVAHRPQRILYSSSSAAYPVDMQRNEGVALKESDIRFDGHIGLPDMTYGWSKLTGEYLSRSAATRYGLHVACIRPFSGYGGDQDETYPIPAIAARAARRDDPFEVWGSGEQGRDFVHIDDCIDAMILAIDRISDGSAVNIGSGVLTSFNETIQIFTELANYAPTLKPLLDKPVGVQTRFADMSFAKQLLNWESGISLREGFARVLADAEQNLTVSGGE